MNGLMKKTASILAAIMLSVSAVVPVGAVETDPTPDVPVVSEGEGTTDDSSSTDNDSSDSTDDSSSTDSDPSDSADDSSSTDSDPSDSADDSSSTDSDPSDSADDSSSTDSDSSDSADDPSSTDSDPSDSADDSSSTPDDSSSTPDDSSSSTDDSSSSTDTPEIKVDDVKVLKTYSSTADAIRINWESVTDADGYRVYRYDNNKWTSIATLSGGSTNTYRNSGLSAGTTYRYKVKAFKRNGAEVVWGNASEEIVAATKLAKTTLSGFSCTTDAIRINWSAVSGADGYGVYRYDEAANDWVLIKTISDSSTVTYRDGGLIAGTSYSYTVKAFKNSGDDTIWGAGSQLAAATKPVKAAITSFSCTTDAIRINWNGTSEADGYRIYRYNSATKKWNNIATIEKSDASTYRDSGLKTGTNYMYKVKAFKKAGSDYVWGSASEDIIAATKPAKVKFTKANRTSNAVRVYWKSTNCSAYKLQRYDSASGTWKTVKLISSNKTNYRISGLSSGTTYKFRILAFSRSDSGNVLGKWSTVYNVTTK